MPPSDHLPDFGDHPSPAGEIGGAAAAPQDARAVARWRKEERARLIAARLAVPADERARVAEAVAATLDDLVRPGPGMVVSLYWPFRGELDLRGWMARAGGEGRARGAAGRRGDGSAPDLPRVAAGVPAGARRLEHPVPADGALVTPDVVLAPLVGFGPDGYRLGYGGGFFDRTLAALSPRAFAIGVGHPVAAIPTIYPQPHDIPMNTIIVGAGPAPLRVDRTGGVS